LTTTVIGSVVGAIIDVSGVIRGCPFPQSVDAPLGPLVDSFRWHAEQFAGRFEGMPVDPQEPDGVGLVGGQSAQRLVDVHPFCVLARVRFGIGVGFA
jgi:hypothetical protein